jgi:hypothetical protein
VESTSVLPLLLLLSICFSLPLRGQEYLPGGPLAGLELPLLKGQHGEPDGYPGAIPGTEFAAADTAAEVELYPGAVEHWRSYYFKYVPMRSMYDQQSQLRYWTATELQLPGIELYASPVYKCGRHKTVGATGEYLRPVPVARLAAGVGFTVDCGKLEQGLYVVRLIAAVETKEIRAFRKALFARVTISASTAEPDQQYRIRLGYCDEFYDVGHVAFHVSESATYAGRIELDAENECELVLHGVSLDDALVGVQLQPFKTKAVHGALKQARMPLTSSETERLQADAAAWAYYPRINSHWGAPAAKGYGSVPGIAHGTPELSAKELAETHGAWKNSQATGVLATNERLGLTYSLDDYAAARPLPKPYPVPDRGQGVTRYSEAVAKGFVHAPLPHIQAVRARGTVKQVLSLSQRWFDSGLEEQAHHAAIRLVRLAYDYPAYELGNEFTSLIREEAAHGRGYRCRRRVTTNVFGHFSNQWALAKAYDRLFPYIKDSELLARSVQRFVPWVKTPADVVRLLDAYLMQTTAKKIMRYQFYGDGREPSVIAEMATLMGDNSLTAPWMDWLFSRAHYYPHPVSGLDDFAITNTGRDGRSIIGSSSYVNGDGNASGMGAKLEEYITRGGLNHYKLYDARQYPKAITSLYFPLRSRTAGIWPMRVGNVSGPDKTHAKGWPAVVAAAANLRAWRWTGDPRFAYVLKHHTDLALLDDAEQSAITQAAAKQARAPWLENRSRLLPEYAAFLETGIDADDHRDRASAMLRIGTGHGHAHFDSLDLQIHANGVPMTIDAGQRPGYSKPGDAATRVHNTVEVDGQKWPSGHAGGTGSYVSAMGDAEGARFMTARLVRNPLGQFARTIGLIDVPPAEVGGHARAYVFDVCRVNGGEVQTYCMHAHVNDPENTEAQPVLNIGSMSTIDGTDAPAAAGGDKAQAAAYLQRFSGKKRFGRSPGKLEVTFTLQKTTVARFGAEKRFLGKLYDPKSPVKHTKWHMFGAEDSLVMTGDLYCSRFKYSIPNVYAQRAATETPFAAIIEPYAGTPFVDDVTVLTPTEASPAVALAVQLDIGRRDVCLSDLPGQAVRRYAGLSVQAESAFLSTDGGGLVQASLLRGGLLQTDGITIEPLVTEYKGTITGVDYAGKEVTVEGQWPTLDQVQGVVELNTAPGVARTWKTSYMAASITPVAGVHTIAFLRSADLYRSRILRIDRHKKTVNCVLPINIRTEGYHAGLTATTLDRQPLGRLTDYRGSTFTFGEQADLSVLQVGDKLLLWEYGVGDSLALATYVDVRRVAARTYRVQANVSCTIRLKGTSLRKRMGDAKWDEPQAGEGGYCAVLVTASDLLHPLYLSVAEAP